VGLRKSKKNRKFARFNVGGHSAVIKQNNKRIYIMRIEKKETEKLTYLLSVTIEKTEANEKKIKSLRDYRKKAEIRGFRKGMAPMGLIEKMYGTSAMAEAVNEMLSEGINNYMKENKLDLIGEPIPDEGLEKKIDWEKDEKFEFFFDFAVKPEIKVDASKSDKVEYYNIKLTPEALKEYKAEMLKQFGKLVDTETAGEEDFMVVDLEQGDKKVEKTYVTLKTLDKDAKKQFLGKKKGDAFQIDVVKAFPNEVDRAALLKVKKEEMDNSNPKYTVKVQEVKTFKPAEETQEVRDRLFGKDTVKTSEEFDAKLTERIEGEYRQESDYRFRKDLVDYMIKKFKLELPEDFLKKWLFKINEGKFTMEQIEKEFPLFLQDYRWQMITRKVVEDQKIQIKKEDLKAEAKKMTANQFAMYGMMDVPEDQLDKYSETVLGNEKEVSKIFEKCEEDKVVDYLKGIITVEKKDITQEELVKMNAKENNK